VFGSFSESHHRGNIRKDFSEKDILVFQIMYMHSHSQVLLSMFALGFHECFQMTSDPVGSAVGKQGNLIFECLCGVKGGNRERLPFAFWDDIMERVHFSRVRGSC